LPVCNRLSPQRAELASDGAGKRLQTVLVDDFISFDQ
jgi:hypothetical protein